MRPNVDKSRLMNSPTRPIAAKTPAVMKKVWAMDAAV